MGNDYKEPFAEFEFEGLIEFLISGQTECVAACTSGVEADYEPGHVGIPISCNAVKLVDVPELNYYAKDQVNYHLV